MKVYYSPHSPFVRKVLVVAHETALFGQLEILASPLTPVVADPEIVGRNPLGQVPTLLADDGTMIADSRVICEYLDSKAATGLFPSGALRWKVLTDQSSADGLLDAALAIRFEMVFRPAERQWQVALDTKMQKVTSVLDHFESSSVELGHRVDIGTISLACALSYLDHRFGHIDWRARRMGLARWYDLFSQRASMAATPLGIDLVAGKI